MAESTQNDLNNMFIDIEKLMDSIRSFLEKMNEHDITTVLPVLANALLAVCNQQMTDASLQGFKEKVEQLNLFAAALPCESSKREPILEASRFIEVFVGTASLHHSWSQASPDSKENHLKQLVVSVKTLESYRENIKTLVQHVDSVFATGSSDQKCPTADDLEHATARLLELCASAQGSWTTAIVPWLVTFIPGRFTSPNIKYYSIVLYVVY